MGLRKRGLRAPDLHLRRRRVCPGDRRIQVWPTVLLKYQGQGAL